jgi:serine/threonine-protein kinase
VLELVEGPTLADRIAQGPIPIDEALPILRQIAEALEVAHEQGIIHRDLKPANVKVKADATVKVLDFGLAKALEPTSAMSPGVSLSPTITSPAMTQAGIILGTAAYMSPEQAKGRAVDKRSDLWAFGVVLYEMLTGRRPFGGEDTADTLAQILTKDPDWTALSPTTPVSIRRLLRRCLEKDRKRRLADAGAARLEIDDASLAADGQGSRVVAPVSMWRRALPVVAAVLVALAFGTGATWRAMRASSLPPGVVRLTIAPSAGESVGTVSPDPDLAVSLDGRRVVYVGERRGAQLYVRDLDRLKATAVSGLTTGFGAVRSPFLSPDGAWVGFFENRSLKKVPVAGGAAVTLCPTTATARGASWGPRNTVIFATSAPDTGLLEVSASGGNPRVLTRPDPAKGEVGHILPEILPGGDAVLFTVVIGPIENSQVGQVAVLNLRTGQYRVLVEGGSNAHYAVSGHIVYALRGALYAVAFDLEHLQVRSDPVLVVERVVTKVVTGAASFSLAHDGSLVYLAGDGVSIARSLVWVDRHGGETPILAPSRGYFDARLSPDGHRVALGVRDPAVGIWIAAFDGTLTRLTSDPSANQYPVWTPNGLRVVYSSGSSLTLFSQAANGTGDAERLGDSTTQMVANSLSPDGTRLVVAQAHPTTGSDLYLVSLADGLGRGTARDARPLIATRFNEQNAEISPDGAWLAYQSDMSGRNEIYVQPFPDVEQGRFPISTGGGTIPLWARSGRELFYFAPDGKLMAVPVQLGHAFSRGNATIAVDRAYFQSIGQGRNYDVSPDGTRFLMIKDAVASSAPAQLVVVQHFSDELKRLVLAR